MPVHPELVEIHSKLRETAPLTRDGLAVRRVEMAKQMRRSAPPKDPRVVCDEREIAGSDDQPLRIRIYRNPSASSWPAPAAVWFHGGAFVLGDLDTEDASCQLVCGRLGAVVVSVDYRLAPENPFPAGVEDCFHGLCWTVASGAELGIDIHRVAIGGHSAGGGLAAAVALMARDRNGPAIAYQFLGIPVLDDRVMTPSCRAITDRRVFSYQGCVAMWDTYLGPDRRDVSPYAAPARSEDVSGLPPAYVLVCEFDPLRDEGLDYARRLIEAGVPTEVHHVPGAWHGFDMYAPRTRLARRVRAAWIEAMGAALGVASAEPALT